MKSKLQISTGILLFLILLPAGSLAQAPAAAPAPVIFDPSTGLPIPPPVQWSDANWKDSNWTDGDIVLTEVSYDGISLAEVARSLNDEFKKQFDVLLPGATSGVAYQNGRQALAGWEHDWRDEPIQLRLRNVTASEVFNAMNLLFENNRTPLRWELKVVGHRQMALLRVLVDPTPQSAPSSNPDLLRRVYFVGDLVGDEKSRGMTMEQIIKTITDVWKLTDTTAGNIQFHTEAQLLVVTGTPDQIAFMDQTLSALKQRTEWERFKYASKPAEGKSKPDESKPATSPK
jgi:hypothetical protein